MRENWFIFNIKIFCICYFYVYFFFCWIKNFIMWYSMFQFCSWIRYSLQIDSNSNKFCKKHCSKVIENPHNKEPKLPPPSIRIIDHRKNVLKWELKRENTKIKFKLHESNCFLSINKYDLSTLISVWKKNRLNFSTCRHRPMKSDSNVRKMFISVILKNFLIMKYKIKRGKILHWIKFSGVVEISSKGRRRKMKAATVTNYKCHRIGEKKKFEQN